jgi:hypothetical protein
MFVFDLSYARVVVCDIQIFKEARVIEFWFAMFECRHVSAFGRLDWFYLFRIKRKNIKIKNERDRDQLPV